MWHHMDESPCNAPFLPLQENDSTAESAVSIVGEVRGLGPSSSTRCPRRRAGEVRDEPSSRGESLSQPTATSR